MGKFAAKMAAELNLSDAQKSQAQSIFREANQSAKPVRQQLRATHQSLQAAIQSGDTNQIQQLSAAEGTERGQLTAIRSAAFSKFYQTLTADQQQKLESMRQARTSHRKAG